MNTTVCLHGEEEGNIHSIQTIQRPNVHSGASTRTNRVVELRIWYNGSSWSESVQHSAYEAISEPMDKCHTFVTNTRAFSHVSIPFRFSFLSGTTVRRPTKIVALSLRMKSCVSLNGVVFLLALVAVLLNQGAQAFAPVSGIARKSCAVASSTEPISDVASNTVSVAANYRHDHRERQHDNYDNDNDVSGGAGAARRRVPFSRFRERVGKRARSFRKAAAVVVFSVCMWRGAQRMAVAEKLAAKAPTVAVGMTGGSETSMTVGKQLPMGAAVVVAVGGGTAVGRKLRSKLDGDDRDKEDGATDVSDTIGADEAANEGTSPSSNTATFDGNFGGGAFIVESEASATVLSGDSSEASIVDTNVESDVNQLPVTQTQTQPDQPTTTTTISAPPMATSATTISTPAPSPTTDSPFVEDENETMLDVPFSVEDRPQASTAFRTRDPYANKPLPSKFAKAREQPKSPSEEAALKAKYDAFDSIEERCFAILLDLGMVVPSIDPNDPDRDTSGDDEYCEQTYKHPQEPSE